MPDTAPSRSPGLAALEAKLDAGVLAQLRAARVAPGRPLLVVDCDEVLVDFAGHLGRFAAGLGIGMELRHYQLEGSFRDLETGRRLDFQEVIGIIHRFFAEETAHQAALPGAAAALGRLAARAQVVVLTNVPPHGTAARVENLAALGMAYPVVQNAGGKGRALAWLAAQAGQRVPAVFVDDSPNQIESAARRAPGVHRVQFVGAPAVADVLPRSAEADHRVGSWAAAEPLIARLLG
ncbi:hypothetical protein LNKW23_31120 [Paralimibaculum aggregatum]|uniref:HAD family hydrolase n=1 Tax=Paralimibaculum aggregatum TaxID=3036245 RepID=A0ABQ6LKY7_9RHOB|nr:hypothetical protein [Limibaculum sp. NKW23]GMG83898.1 hypothetical protein LNKW23_31120 [Limibaculum sp. NKW23]